MSASKLRLPKMAESLTSPPALKGDVTVQDPDLDMIRVLNDLSTTQQTYSSQKKHKANVKLIENARIKLHQDSLSQLTKLKQGREKSEHKIQLELTNAMEKIVDYLTRSNEFLNISKARLKQHLDDYTTSSENINAVLGELQNGMSQTSQAEIDEEIAVIREQLKGKMLQLEKRLYEVEKRHTN